MSDALNALLYPFVTDVLPQPESGRGFLLRAEADPALGEPWRRLLVCEQSLKPAFDQLERLRFKVETQLSGDGYDFGLCLLSKHKGENLANMGRAWQALAPGGLLVCAGGNDSGGTAALRALKTAAGEVNSLSKYHCKVFWVRRTPETPPELAAWAEAGRLRLAPETGFFSRPGLYNWDKVDRGSALLMDNLPADVAGRVADLGAGWGYLSARLLESGRAIASVDLYEAEGMALEAAKANLGRIQTSARIGYHWHDVTAGLPKPTRDPDQAPYDFRPPKAAYDVVLMNPPFHQGKEADIDLGKAFIAAASDALGPRGRLIFVANRHLPYEPVVQAKFRRQRVVVENNWFKVIEAVK